MLDLSADAGDAHRRARRRRVGVGGRGAPRRSRRERAERLPAADRGTRGQRRRGAYRPGPARRLVLAGPSRHRARSPTTCRHGSTDGLMYGCGTSDMKSGVAVLLRIAHLVGTGELEPAVDLTFVCYDCEEIEAERNGLRRLSRARPELLAADLAVLLEPTDGLIEGGCQGTLRVEVRVPGRAGPQCPVVAGRERDPRGGAGAGDAGRLRRARGRGRRADLSRGPQRGLRPRGSRRQRHTGRVRGDGQLPVRAGPFRGGGVRPRPRAVPRRTR